MKNMGSGNMNLAGSNTPVVLECDDELMTKSERTNSDVVFVARGSVHIEETVVIDHEE